MVAPYAPAAPGWRRPTLRHRVTSMALALLISVLFLLALMSFGAQQLPKRSEGAVVTFDVEAPSPGTKAPRPTRKAQAQKAATPPRPPERPRIPPPELTLQPNPTSPYLQLTKEQFAATDISKIPRTARSGGAQGQETADASEGGGGGEGNGAGPGGARLYRAEWEREPTDGELAFYLKGPRPPGAWAMIACKTVPGNRVEDCRILGESPPGSGLARGIREAAWQFRVLPPRVGSKRLIGAWVSIRIEFTKPAKG